MKAAQGAQHKGTQQHPNHAQRRAVAEDLLHNRAATTSIKAAVGLVGVSDREDQYKGYKSYRRHLHQIADCVWQCDQYGLQWLSSKLRCAIDHQGWEGQ
eukprot:8716265-Heterocapsa_arctica.AAC.1